jgi:hypothetical protein
VDGAAGGVAVAAQTGWLRSVVVAAGLAAAVLFVVVGLGAELQAYGDASIFSYAVAVQDAWAFHWHNISGRAFVYVSTLLPAEAYVALTGDTRGGIAVYGFLFFAAQLAGLAATFASDRSQGRIVFATACLSTACLCPLVFGFPTETWLSHALFWPALAVCHNPRRGGARFVLVVAVLAALMLTHEGALVFALAILGSLLLRGWRDAAFLRGACAFAVALSFWALVKLAFPPEYYFARILPAAALSLVDPANLATAVFVLLAAALAAYAVALLALRRVGAPNAPVQAAALVAAGLAVYWLWFDRSLHADHRYAIRTALFIGTPALGMLAAACAVDAEGRLAPPLLPRLSRHILRHLRMALAGPATARALAGALALVMLVHVVETAKFVAAWTAYKAALQALAMGTASDPELGSERFVSAARLGPALNRMGWNSTTHYLSVLVAPGFAPARLVVDPEAGYFWLTCATATANEEAARAIPQESRRLVRVHACLHRVE